MMHCCVKLGWLHVWPSYANLLELHNVEVLLLLKDRLPAVGAGITCTHKRLTSALLQPTYHAPPTCH